MKIKGLESISRDLNVGLRKESVAKTYDYYRSTPDAYLKGMLEEHLKNNNLETYGPWLGWVLRVEGNGYEPNSWYAEAISSAAQANPDMNIIDLNLNPVAIKVRVPGLHNDFEIPTAIGPEGDHGLIDMFPTFYQKPNSAPPEIPTPGSIVEVDFKDRKNFLDPVYIAMAVNSNNLNVETVNNLVSSFAPTAERFHPPADLSSSERDLQALASMLLCEVGWSQKHIDSGEMAAAVFVAINRSQAWKANLYDVVYSRVNKKNGYSRNRSVWNASPAYIQKLEKARKSKYHGKALEFAKQALAGKVLNPIGKRNRFVHLVTQLEKGHKVPSWIVPKDAATGWTPSPSLKVTKKLSGFGYGLVGSPVVIPPSKIRTHKTKTKKDGTKVRIPLGYAKPTANVDRTSVTIGRMTIA